MLYIKWLELDSKQNCSLWHCYIVITLRKSQETHNIKTFFFLHYLHRLFIYLFLKIVPMIYMLDHSS